MWSRSERYSLIIPPAGAVVVAVILTLVLAQPATGTYENARAVGQRCATCHTGVRPNAGTLNETGRYYQLRRTLEGAPGLTLPPLWDAASEPSESDTSRNQATSSSERAPSAVATTAAEDFRQSCAPCHGEFGEGTQIAKSLRSSALAAQSLSAVEHTIREGVPNTAMVAFDEVLSSAQIEGLARHVIGLAKSH